MLYILAIADRGLVSHAQAFQTRKAAEEGLVRYLKKNEAYHGSDVGDAWRWLEEHDERLSAEIVEQTVTSGADDAMTALRRIYDVLYLDLKGNREFYNKEKPWDADTTADVAEIVRKVFPKPPGEALQPDEEDLTPADRVGFVQRIEHVSPYDEGLDAEDNIVSPSDFITDLLTDIRHYCDARGVEFAASDRSAYRHYVNERHESNQKTGSARKTRKRGDTGQI
jgi:hypothetical protein